MVDGPNTASVMNVMLVAVKGGLTLKCAATTCMLSMTAAQVYVASMPPNTKLETE